ncbi:sugar ABC transporter substrate-binding protein [Chloroflexi bacterium TSY]|nr:sugar ABC transporter substrate-binding protein [Chloroflexi bacterium TSY]
MFAFLCILSLLVAACAGADAPAAGDGGDSGGEAASEDSGSDAMADGDAVVIFAVQHGECAWDSFWCTVQEGMMDAAEDLGVDLTLLAPDEFDLDKEVSMLEQAVAAQPDGIMTTVPDPVLFGDAVNSAIDQGIPVVVYNAGSGPEADGIPYLTYVGQDEYAGGYLGGKRLIAAGGGTRGVCLNQQVGHTGLDARCQGFADALAEAGLESEVVAINNDPAESTAIIGDYYAANPDTDIFMTLGPNGATPFYAFLDNEGLGEDEFIHGTFDLGEQIEANILSGVTQFGINQQPYLQGYGSVTILHHLIKYGVAPASGVTATGPGFVDVAMLENPPDPEAEVNIFAVQHGECAWDSFWCVVQQGMNDAAEAMGVNLTLLAPDEFDLDKEVSMLEQAVAGAPDGIMTTVPDPVLFADAVNSALDQGIPVVVYNAGSGPDADGIPYSTYIGQDEYAGGYNGAKILLANGGGTRGVCLNQGVGHTGLDARCQGFTDALAEAGIDAEVLAINNDPAESTAIIGDYYAANPDTDIFMTLGPNGATPFYAFLDNEGLGADEFIHGTFDLSEQIVANIQSGVTQFGVDQQPYLQGYNSVMYLALGKRQGITPAGGITPTGPGFVTQDNIDIVTELAGTYR